MTPSPSFRCLYDETDGAVDIYECAGLGCVTCREWMMDQEADWRVDDREEV